MTKLDYAVYDAFSANPYGGSIAALVADAQDLNADQMQQIAKEFGAPATGFITGFDGTTVDIRFFSTQTEYPMCGHGTIALACLLVERGHISLDELTSKSLIIRTPASQTNLTINHSSSGQPEAMLALQAASFKHFMGQLSEVAKILGVASEQILSELPMATTSTDFNHLIIPFTTLEAVDSLAPNFIALSEFCRINTIDTVMVYCLDTENNKHTVHCREFAPAVGTNEAAATGTTNRALACYLHTYKVIDMPENGTKTIYAEQGYAMGRPSVVKSEILLKNAQVVQVNVGGVATCVMEGKLTI